MDRARFPLAYHITFGTYGTRLHGDARGTVHREANGFGEPIVGMDQEWLAEEVARLQFPRRFLTPEQRIAVQEAVPAICERGGWRYVIAAAARDHVHALIGAGVEGRDVRKWLKRWVSEVLSATWPMLPGQVWWAEGGSVKWVYEADYLERVRGYIGRQRAG